MYKGVGRWEGGGVSGGGGWEAGGGLHHTTGLFGVAMSPRSASHRPRHDWKGLKRRLTNTGVNIRPIPPI